MNEYIKTFRYLKKFSKDELYEVAILMGLELGRYSKKEIILFLIVKNESIKAVNAYKRYMKNLT